jgi:hypothetical protein
MYRLFLTTAVCLCAVAADASAQIVQRPSRPYRGLFGGGPATDPNRARTELTFTGSLLLGHDTWLSPGGSGGGIDPGRERQSGRTFSGEAAVRYYHGRAQRSVSIDGRTLTLGYSGIGVDPTINGHVAINAQTNLGSVGQLRATQSFAYEPTLVLGGTGSTLGDGGTALDPGATIPVVSAVTSGYLEQRSWSSNSSASLERRWTPRHMTQVNGGYMRATFLDELGYDTRSVRADGSHMWQFARTSSIRGLYSFVESNSDAAAGLTTTMTNQRVEGSFAYSRRLSPTRHMSFSVGVGGTHVTTLNAEDRSPLDYWMPSGAGSFAIDLGRSWAASSNYTRTVSVLQGVSLTSFATDSANVSVSGLINTRIETSISATYSNGQAGGSNTQGRFENYTGSVQLRYAISRCCATAINYDYYVYNFEDVADLSAGFLSNFDRQAIRVGFTLWLPLYGRYSDGPARSR